MNAMADLSVEQKNGIAHRHAGVTARLQAAVTAAGRDPGSVRLLAVSKGQPSAAIRELYALGQREFGENYVQEMVAKAAELADLKELRWSFIGQLQSNKLRDVARLADAVQSLASARHGEALARHLKNQGKFGFPVHILVNAGDEASKDGVKLTAARSLADALSAYGGLFDVRGVMAIPPPLPPRPSDRMTPPPLYAELRRLATTIGAGELSLGMTADLEEAVLAGSDCVRIGTALFGERRRS